MQGEIRQDFQRDTISKKIFARNMAREGLCWSIIQFCVHLRLCTLFGPEAAIKRAPAARTIKQVSFVLGPGTERIAGRRMYDR